MIEIARTIADSSAPPEEFYARWIDIDTHPEWATTMEWTRLDEPFAVGAHGWLKAKGGEAAPFVVTEVVEGRLFADDTTLDGATLRIRHEAQPRGTGSTLTITGLLDGPRRDDYAALIAADVQRSIETNLASLIARLESSQTLT